MLPVRILLLLFCAFPAVTEGQDPQLLAPPGLPTVTPTVTPTVADERTARRRYLTLGAGIVGASVTGQLLGSPEAWPRTWGGYSRRVGDQIGFAVAERSVEALVSRAVPWTPDSAPCTTLARPSINRALGCGVTRTFTLRTAQGERRPNLPFITGVVVATATSLAWRPEADNAVKARSLVGQRIGIVFGATVLRSAYTEWRARR